MEGYPTFHINVFKLKREIIWTGKLPQLSGLPHLTGVPHNLVNRPLEKARERRSKHVEADQKQEDRKLEIAAPNELERLTLFIPY